MKAYRALRRLVRALEALDACGGQRASGCMQLRDVGGDDAHGLELIRAYEAARKALREIEAAEPN